MVVVYPCYAINTIKYNPVGPQSLLKYPSCSPAPYPSTDVKLLTHALTLALRPTQM